MLYSVTSQHRANAVSLNSIEIKDNRLISPFTLLFIHGADSALGSWSSIIDPLKDKYRFIMIDLRGHGESPIGNGDFSIGQMIADVEKLVQEKKLEKFVVIGHSMGVRIAIPYAVTHPEQVQALVLEDLHTLPATKFNFSIEEVEFRKTFKSEHTSLHEARQEAFLHNYKSEKFESWLKDGRVKLLKNGNYHIGVHPYVSYLARNNISASQATQAAFEALNIKNTPVLLLRAEKFSCVSDEGLQLMQSTHPTIQYKFIPNSDHSIHKTATQAFINALNEFIDKI